MAADNQTRSKVWLRRFIEVAEVTLVVADQIQKNTVHERHEKHEKMLKINATNWNPMGE